MTGDWAPLVSEKCRPMGDNPEICITFVTK